MLVAKANEFATDLPQVVTVAVEGGSGGLATQHVDEEWFEDRDDGVTRGDVFGFVLPADWPFVQIRAGLAKQGVVLGWDNCLLDYCLP